MRKRSICLISVLALAGCAKANAATVDPNSDYDCAFTFRFWGGLAKIHGASDITRQGLFVFEEWYIDKWEAEHPNAPDPRSQGREILNALAVDPVMSKQAIMTCTDRAAADPAFNRFATLLSKKMPDAR